MSNVDQGLKDMVSVLQVHAEAVSAVSVNQELLLALEYLVRVRDIKCLHTDSCNFDYFCANCRARKAIRDAEAL